MIEKKMILVVDDEPDFASIVQTNLEIVANYRSKFTLQFKEVHIKDYELDSQHTYFTHLISLLKN